MQTTALEPRRITCPSDLPDGTYKGTLVGNRVRLQVGEVTWEATTGVPSKGLKDVKFTVTVKGSLLIVSTVESTEAQES